MRQNPHLCCIFKSAQQLEIALKLLYSSITIMTIIATVAIGAVAITSLAIATVALALDSLIVCSLQIHKQQQ